MSTPFFIYGHLEFPPKKLAAWREAPIEDHLEYERGNAFEATTVGAVIDEAASFGFAYGQLVEVEESKDAIALRAYLVDDDFWQMVKPIVTAFHAAAAFGATGDMRVAEAPGHPDVLTVGKGKAKIDTPRKAPPDDERLQSAILERLGELSAKKKGKEKKKR